MSKITKNDLLKTAEEAIGKLANKEFNVYFFVMDTKGNPSTMLEYIYDTALVLKDMGYKVTMLHQEKDFVGVGDWLGEEYANLPHANIEDKNVMVGPSDFLFVPDIFANVLMQTAKLTCKRVVIVQNADNLTEFMPVHQTMDSMKVIDAVVIDERQGAKLNKWFPDVRTHVVSPCVKSMYRDGDQPRKLLINVISPDQSMVNKLIKPFYWTNPMYKWVSFRDLRGLPREMLADSLRNNAMTIWMDDDNPFGLELLEALRCGSVVLAKVPKNPASWMLSEDGSLTDKIIWFDDFETVADNLGNLIRTWTLDQIDQAIYDGQQEISGGYGEDRMKREVEYAYVRSLFEKRLEEFRLAKADVENNVIKPKEDGE